MIRNRIKRVVRESFRHHMVELPHCDIIVIARRGLVPYSTQAIHKALTEKWAQLAQWKG